jgi:membrane protease YdiL (CAAX protease family)
VERKIIPGGAGGGPGEIPWLRRFRYLIDIIVLAAAAVAWEVAVGNVYTSGRLESAVIFDAATKIPAVLFGWLLIRLRGEILADIGLKRPRRWWQTILFGLVIAAVIFAAVYVSEKAGFHRDLSQFKAVQGNLQLALYDVVYAFIGAGFYEEFMFRGFLFHGFAMFFGASRGAWIVACVAQAALFGLAHSYQNPLGIAITGLIGLLMGLVFLGTGRNLWAPIIGHGVYDASRFILFYFHGPPIG